MFSFNGMQPITIYTRQNQYYYDARFRSTNVTVETYLNTKLESYICDENHILRDIFLKANDFVKKITKFCDVSHKI